MARYICPRGPRALGRPAPLYFPVAIGPEIDHKTDCAGVEVAAVETPCTQKKRTIGEKRKSRWMAGRSLRLGHDAHDTAAQGTTGKGETLRGEEPFMGFRTCHRANKHTAVDAVDVRWMRDVIWQQRRSETSPDRV